MLRTTSPARIAMASALLAGVGCAHSALAQPLNRPSPEHIDQVRQALREGRLDPRRVALIDAIDEVVVGIGKTDMSGRGSASLRYGVTGNPNPWAGIIDPNRDFHEGFEASISGYEKHVSLADAADYRPLAGQVAPNGSTWLAAPAYTGVVDNAIAQTGQNWGEPNGQVPPGVHGVPGGPDPTGLRSDFLAVPRGTIDPQDKTTANLFQARLTHKLYVPTAQEPVYILVDLYTDSIDSFNWWRPVSFTEGFIVTNVFVGGYDFGYFAPFVNNDDIVDRLIILGPKINDQGDFFVAADNGHTIQEREWMSFCLRISTNSFTAWVRDSTTVGVYGFPGDGDGTFIAPHGAAYSPADFTATPMDLQLKDGWLQFYPGYPDDPTSSRVEGHGVAYNSLLQQAQRSPDNFGYPAGPLLFTQSVDALQFIAGGDPTEAQVPGFQPKDSYIDNYTVIGPRFGPPDVTPDEKIPFFDDIELWNEGPLSHQGDAWQDFGSAADVVTNQNHTPGGTQSVRQVGVISNNVFAEHYRRRIPRAIADTSTPSVVELYVRLTDAPRQGRAIQPADGVDTGDWLARVILGGRDDNFLVDDLVYVRQPNPNFDPNQPAADVSGENVIHLNGLNTPFVNVPLFDGASPITTPSLTWFPVRIEALDDGLGTATGSLRVFIDGVEGLPDGSVEGVTALTTNALSADSLRFFGGNESSGHLHQMWIDDIFVSGPVVLIPTPLTVNDPPFTDHPPFASPYFDDFDAYSPMRPLGGQGFAPFLQSLFTDTGGELDVIPAAEAPVAGVTMVYTYEIDSVLTGGVPGGHGPGETVAVIDNIAPAHIPSQQPVPGSSVGNVTLVNFRNNNLVQTGLAKWALQSASPAVWDGATPVVGRYWFVYSVRWASSTGLERVTDDAPAGALRDTDDLAVRFMRPGSGSFNSLLPRTPATSLGERGELSFDLYIHADEPAQGPRNRMIWTVNAAASSVNPPQIAQFVFGGPNNFEDNFTLNTTTGQITAAPDGRPDNFDGSAFQSDPTKLYVLRPNPISGVGIPAFILQQEPIDVPLNTWLRATIAVHRSGAWTATFDDGAATHTVTGAALQGNSTGSNVRQLERLQFTVPADAGGDGGAITRPIVWTSLGESATPEGGLDPLDKDAGTGSYNTTLKYLYYEIFQITPPSAMPTLVHVNAATGALQGTRSMAVGDVVAMWNDEGSAAFAGTPGAPIATVIPKVSRWEFTTDAGATRAARGTWIPLGVPGNEGVNNPAPKGGIVNNAPAYNAGIPFRTMLMASMIDGRNLPLSAPTFPPADIFSINEPRYPDQIDAAGDPWRAWVDNVLLRRAGCFGDFNGDDQVNGADLGLLLGAWSTNNPDFDLNDSGNVDGADLGLLLGAWGPCP